MMQRKLRQVLATRPVEQNTAWREKLLQRGFDVVSAPLMQIEPLDLAVNAKIRSVLTDLDQFSHVIFVSQNAVGAMLSAIDMWWPQLPSGQSYIAVGEKTARVLRDGLTCLGVLAEVLVASAMNSETLLELAELQADKINDKKILICRGLGGRPLLAEQLELRGAVVKYCELYQRLVPSDLAEKLSGFTAQLDALLPVFSGEALENFCAASDNRLATVIVPSQRVANLAIAAGFKQVRVAINASEDAMLQTIVDVCGE